MIFYIWTLISDEETFMDVNFYNLAIATGGYVSIP